MYRQTFQYCLFNFFTAFQIIPWDFVNLKPINFTHKALRLMFLPKFYQFVYNIVRIYAAPVFCYKNLFNIEEFLVSIWWNPDRRHSHFFCHSYLCFVSVSEVFWKRLWSRNLYSKSVLDIVHESYDCYE